MEDVSEVLQRGERVWCKIIAMGEDGKIGLSMKHVNQGNGTDLDPNGVKQQMDEQRRKTIVPRERKLIQLEAVLNTTCAKCGTVGHLASDCFTSPGGKKYDLIPEIEDEILSIPDIKNLPEKKHKSKKVKKKKKKSHKHDSDSESDDSKEDKERKKRKKHSKDQKRKKKRDSSSSTHSESEDSDSKQKKKVTTRDSSERHSKKCKRSKSKY